MCIAASYYGKKKKKKNLTFEIIDVKLKESPVRNVLGKRCGRDSNLVVDGTIKAVYI